MFFVYFQFVSTVENSTLCGLLLELSDHSTIDVTVTFSSLSLCTSGFESVLVYLKLINLVNNGFVSDIDQDCVYNQFESYQTLNWFLNVELVCVKNASLASTLSSCHLLFTPWNILYHLLFEPAFHQRIFMSALTVPTQSLS